MKAFTLTTLILPASAFVGPASVRVQYRTAPSQELEYRRQPMCDDDASFENLRREFTTAEPTAEKAKEIVDRTFRLFQDLNRDVSPSAGEKERNQEFLSKLQKWIDRSIDISEEFSRDFPEPTQPETDSSKFTTATAQGERVFAEAPRISDTGDAFEVELDIPGVEFSDLDLRLDEKLKIVTVLGQRGGRSFSRGIALDSDADIEKLSASLKNGVLKIRAPKMQPRQNNAKRIPVVVD